MKNTLLGLAVALTAVSSFGAIRAVTPTVWDGGTNSWQMQRFNAKMSWLATNRDTRVVFIGDSITHFWDGNGKTSWDRYFAKGPRKAINLGISGDRTEHVLWRITEGKALDGIKARCIVLLIGVNNQWHFPFAEEPPVDTILGIREVLAVLRKKQPQAHIVLQPIFPCMSGPNDQLRKRCETVNREIVKFADDSHVVWCDFTDKFLDAEGRLAPELFPDYVHPNARGYQIWANSLVPLIDRILAVQPGEAVPGVWPSNPRNYVHIAPAKSFAAVPMSSFPQGNWWETRCLEKRNEIVDNGKIEYDIVMVGDSITHRWERLGGEGRELFAKLKETYKILNLGYGGDRTQHVIWRMENGELEGYKAKLFMVMIGTNNGVGDIEGVAAGTKRILDTIRTKHPESKILLLPIFPHGADPKCAKRVGTAKIDAITKGYADGKTIRWLDFNQKFLEPDGTLTKRTMNDLLHPNATGYQIWLDAVLPVFREICGK